MLKEDENNEKTKKNKNARGDDENAKNAFVAKMRPANVEGRKRSADENRQIPADDRKRSTEEEMQRLNNSANNKRRLNNDSANNKRRLNNDSANNRPLRHNNAPEPR